MQPRGRREIENRWMGCIMEDEGDQKEAGQRRDNNRAMRQGYDQNMLCARTNISQWNPLFCIVTVTTKTLKMRNEKNLVFSMCENERTTATLFRAQSSGSGILGHSNYSNSQLLPSTTVTYFGCLETKPKRAFLSSILSRSIVMFNKYILKTQTTKLLSSRRKGKSHNGKIPRNFYLHAFVCSVFPHFLWMQ